MCSAETRDNSNTGHPFLPRFFLVILVQQTYIFNSNNIKIIRIFNENGNSVFNKVIKIITGLLVIAYHEELYYTEIQYSQFCILKENESHFLFFYKWNYLYVWKFKSLQDF